MPEVVIGEDVITGELITFGELERRGGVYIPGRSGTSKSTLLISLVLQDIQLSGSTENSPCRKR